MVRVPGYETVGLRFNPLDSRHPTHPVSLSEIMGTYVYIVTSRDPGVSQWPCFPGLISEFTPPQAQMRGLASAAKRIMAYAPNFITLIHNPVAEAELIVFYNIKAQVQVINTTF